MRLRHQLGVLVVLVLHKILAGHRADRQKLALEHPVVFNRKDYEQDYEQEYKDEKIQPNPTSNFRCYSRSEYSAARVQHIEVPIK